MTQLQNAESYVPLVGGAPGRLGVFADNRRRPIHRWYPFIEGYSADLVERAIRQRPESESIFDPFGGSGTTPLTAAFMGYSSSYTEANPYMAWLADVKVNQCQLALQRNENLKELRKYAMLLNGVELDEPDSEHPLLVADRARKYFPTGVAEDIVSILNDVDLRFEGPLRELSRLAVAAAIVPSSNMLRRTDLRRRRVGERPPLVLREVIVDNLNMIADDVETVGKDVTGKAAFVGHDAKGRYSPHVPYDLIITSPPYLNGTNYGRNTKLELLALGFLANEAGLESLRLREITAGINNVAKRNAIPRTISRVELVADQVAENTYDKRIPAMIRAYFSEMHTVFERISEASVEGAELWMDIGDSKYSGVSVPTHELLSEVAQDAGWEIHGEETIRQRRSYDGSLLVQALIKMRKS